MTDDQSAMVPQSRPTEHGVDVQVTLPLPPASEAQSCSAPTAAATGKAERAPSPMLAATEWTEMSLSDGEPDSADSRPPPPPTVIVTAPSPRPRAMGQIFVRPSGAMDSSAADFPVILLPRALGGEHPSDLAKHEQRREGQRRLSIPAMIPDTPNCEEAVETCENYDSGHSVVNSQPSSPATILDIPSILTERTSHSAFRSPIPLGNDTEFAAINRPVWRHSEPPAVLPHFLSVPINYFTAAVTSPGGKQPGTPHSPLNRVALASSDGQLPLQMSPTRGEVRTPKVRPFGVLQSPWLTHPAHLRDEDGTAKGPHDDAQSRTNDEEDENDQSGAVNGPFSAVGDGHLSRRRRRASVVQLSDVAAAGEETGDEEMEQLPQPRQTTRVGRGQRSERRRPLAIAKWRADGNYAYALEDLGSSRSMGMVLRRSGHSIAANDDSQGAPPMTSGQRHARDPLTSPLSGVVPQDAQRLSLRYADSDGLRSPHADRRPPTSCSNSPLFLRSPPGGADDGSRALAQRISFRWSPFALNKVSTPRLPSHGSFHDESYIPDTDDINRLRLLNAQVMYNEHLAEQEAMLYTGGDAGEQNFFNIQNNPSRDLKSAQFRAKTPEPLSSTTSSEGGAVGSRNPADFGHSRTLPWSADTNTAANTKATSQSERNPPCSPPPRSPPPPPPPPTEGESNSVAGKPTAAALPPPSSARQRADVSQARATERAPGSGGNTDVNLSQLTLSSIELLPPTPGQGDVEPTKVNGAMRMVSTSKSVQVALPQALAKNSSPSQLKAATVLAAATVPPLPSPKADHAPRATAAKSPRTRYPTAPVHAKDLKSPRSPEADDAPVGCSPASLRTPRCAAAATAVNPTLCVRPKITVPRRDVTETNAAPPVVAEHTASPTAQAVPPETTSKAATPSSRPRAKSQKGRGPAAAPRTVKCIPADIFWDVNVSLPLRNVRLTMSPAPPLFM